MMMKRKWMVAGFFVALVTLFASLASAQTSMQRRAAEEAGETEQAEDAETSETSESTADERPATQTQRRGSEPETIRAGDDEDQIFHAYGVHKPGLRVDVGGGGASDQAQWGIGLGYVYMRGWEIIVLDQLQGLIRGGAGPDLTLLVDGDGFNGLAGFMTGRVQAIATGRAGGGIEAGLGTGIGGAGFAPAARLGVSLAWRYFELGYFYQMTFFHRPAWMPPHNFGIRLHIPFLKH